VKIRDLFQHIDSLCGEGRFPASLFDSEGQIDSEDVGLFFFLSSSLVNKFLISIIVAV
jgi:hypothetical protein